MPRISEEKKTARRVQILEGAWRCFERQGLHATTMQDIIGECGLSAGAVYLYFATKDALILEAVTTSLAALAALATPILAESPPLPPPLLATRVIAVVADFSRRDGYDLRRIALLGWSEAQRNADLKERMQSAYHLFRSRLVEIARVWQHTGVVARDSDAEALAATCLAVILGYVVESTILGDVTPEAIGQGLSALRVRAGEEQEALRSSC